VEVLDVEGVFEALLDCDTVAVDVDDKDNDGVTVGVTVSVELGLEVVVIDALGLGVLLIEALSDKLPVEVNEIEDDIDSVGLFDMVGDDVIELDAEFETVEDGVTVRVREALGVVEIVGVGDPEILEV
jgi:hypothetical protein